MNRLIRPEGRGDPNGATMGFALLLVALCSQVAQWMPVAINSMIVSLGLALIAAAFGAAGVIRSGRIVITGIAVIALTLFVSVEHLRYERAERCSCTQASVPALLDPVAPMQMGLNTGVKRSNWQGQLS